MFRKSILALILLISLAGTPGCQTESPVVSTGKTAPGFELFSLSGNRISLVELRGQPVVVNFWALSCPYCLDEMPYFQQLKDSYDNSAQSPVILMINIGNPASTIESYMTSENLSLTVLLDSRAQVAGAYGVVGIPITVFIDKDGIIRDIAYGAFPNLGTLEKRMESIVD
ncbi:MAG: TlpA family protein disulfide reductase [Dehalococcoidaceae bacterium]|nr:TlpA family protein disulfide reductase [Dehalococcoidaceae bacterium]